MKAVRLISKLYEYKGISNHRLPAFLLFIDTGSSTSVSGTGPIYRKFLQSKSLGDYSGSGSQLKTPQDKNYGNADLKLVPFDTAFTYLPIDVNQRKICYFLFFDNLHEYDFLSDHK